MSEDLLFVLIEDFPDYYITTRGEVFNNITNRKMTLSDTLAGDPTVGLMRDGRQYRRSVKVLVAEAFVGGETHIFNTPIQLDGNKYNLHAENIVWRPLWFAWKYTRQFKEPYPWYEDGPITDIAYAQRYHTILEASMSLGVLCADIYESMNTGRAVFPTGSVFV